MTQVDFYILSEAATGDRFTLACRLAEKIWQQGRRIYLHTDSEAESRHLDRLLWTYREGSFIPHGLADRADPALNPILIGHGDNAGEEHDVLVNLASEVPGFFSRFERVVEPVDSNSAVRLAGRSRYRFYRDRGYPLNSHDIQR
ncbi:MAG: DNA polymerase III subunit chi [Gammaproteobacteria bacterium]|nr:DNA polymerase III subunit chi [Gammaproteobacteria bacterium]MCP5409173.1 DNA polymerase III subunit chi [Chromatiaceae bacterium]MCP5443764.1 DNA polymerase III subunit chi [Chromatiaceae bacterium]